MDKAVKAKWLTALRSGEYEQGTQALCRDGRYCCLGVLAEELGLFDDNYEVNNSPWMLRDRDDIVSWEAQAELAQMNDNEGKSFSEIADWIEEHL